MMLLLLLGQILDFLYDKEIIREEAILKWASEKEGAEESDKVFVKQSEKFIQVGRLCALKVMLKCRSPVFNVKQL